MPEALTQIHFKAIKLKAQAYKTGSLFKFLAEWHYSIILFHPIGSAAV
jgi:hypothetical protein